MYRKHSFQAHKSQKTWSKSKRKSEDWNNAEYVLWSYYNYANNHSN